MDNFLPGFDKVNPVNSGSMGSMADAARPWNAAIGAGQQVSDAGDQMVGIAVKQKELEVKRKAAEMELEFAQMKSAYEQEVIKNPNMTAEEAQQGWAKTSEGFMSRHVNGNMSGLEQDVIGMRARQLQQRAGSEIAKTSIIKDMALSKQAQINLIKHGKQTGNYEEVEMGLAGLRGLIPDEQIEDLTLSTYTSMASESLNADIQDDPLGNSEMFVDQETFLEKNPLLSPNDFYEKKQAWQRAEGQYMNERMGDLMEYMANGEIKKPEDVSKFFPEIAGYSPAAIAEMEGVVTKSILAKKKATEDLRAQDPSYHRSFVNQMIGRASLWNPKTYGMDLEKADMMQLLEANVPKTSPYYKGFMDYLGDKEGSVETAEQSMAQVKLDRYLSAMDRDVKGKKTQIQTAKSAIQTGFLSPTRLTRMGFSDEQAKVIGQLYQPYNEKGVTAYDDPKDAQAALKKQVDKFRLLYPRRANKGSEDISEFEEKMAMAIFNGETGKVEASDFRYDDNYMESRGSIISKFNKWATENPELAKDEEKVNAYFNELKKGQLRSQSLQPE